jgi:hypothetical protein
VVLEAECWVALDPPEQVLLHPVSALVEVLLGPAQVVLVVRVEPLAVARVEVQVAVEVVPVDPVLLLDVHANDLEPLIVVPTKHPTHLPVRLLVVVVRLAVVQLVVPRLGHLFLSVECCSLGAMRLHP